MGRACVQVLAGCTGHGFTEPSAAEAQTDRVDGSITAPPRMVDLSVTHVPAVAREPPGAVLLMHLEQAWMHSRIHASGDEGLDRFGARGCSSSPSPPSGSSVPKGRVGLILRGLFNSRKDVAPGKFTLSQGFAQLSQKKLSRVGRERRDEACEGSISAHNVFCHDELVRDAKGVAEVVNHDGHQGAAHDAAGDDCGERDAQRRAEAQSAARDSRFSKYVHTRVIIAFQSDPAKIQILNEIDKK